ncbi:unnamed protein product [Rotaria sp. Silwood1]|nr:unnamed protein product [Rotaria sp. Silwood1]
MDNPSSLIEPIKTTIEKVHNATHDNENIDTSSNYTNENFNVDQISADLEDEHDHLELNSNVHEEAEDEPSTIFGSSSNNFDGQPMCVTKKRGRPNSAHAKSEKWSHDDYAMYYCDHHRMKCNEEQSTYSKLSDEELKRYLVYLKHLNREESQCNVGRSDIEERFEQKKKSMGFIASFLNCGIIVGFSDSVNHEGPRKITDHLLTMMKLGGKLPSLLVYDAACQLHKFWMYRFGGEHMKNTAYTQELMNMILVCDRFHNTVHKGDLCKTVFNPDSEQNRNLSIVERKKILITRNGSLKNDDRIYFDKFFDSIREYSQYCLTLNEHDMNKIYSLLKSIIFEYNKSKCIKRITDDLFADAISNLENLLNANVDDLCQKITYNKSKKSSADYYYLKEKSRSLEEYILTLFNWINYIISNRHAIKNNKNNVELKIILEFQVTGELLYDSEIFCSMLSKVYSIDNDAERILYYLDKVSAHQRSLNLILKTLHKRKSEYGEIYKNIQWSFIEPIEQIVELKTTP